MKDAITGIVALIAMLAVAHVARATPSCEEQGYEAGEVAVMLSSGYSGQRAVETAQREFALNPRQAESLVETVVVAMDDYGMPADKIEQVATRACEQYPNQ